MKRIEFKLEEELINLLNNKINIKELSRSEYIRNLILKDISNTNNTVDISTLNNKKRLTVSLEKVELIKKKRIEFQCDEDLLKLLDVRAEIKEISRSEYIRNLILKDVGNINNNIDIDTLKKIKKLTVEYKKMRVAFNKLGVVFNQGIKLFIKDKKEELEALEDKLMKLLDEEKEKLEEYKKYLL
ncbi:hypothetical protein CA839_12220 [Fusobacterium polymorphum]|uniref:Ribbon-helix-helix protein CopG domain-containing protein n=1 Tax=Fusobacterium nucleatum subsp. polymorphum TaxID=76857 RepID=A0A246ECU2_FUSNP|nr:ribbon-helix-helix protein, CopG family [Fusobacterium polymorphum]OWP23726.1 hypothetical protein CA839_12220 [Fusobacterium polymorphum]